jgi:YjbE family integral membrane protein
MLAQLSQPDFWLAAVQIIWADMLLSGDNAVVIAVACRRLPPRQRRWGMMIGAGLAALVLIVFTGVVTTLNRLPYLRMLSGMALLWIAIRLIAVPHGEGKGDVRASANLWQAVRIIVVADLIMSLDNAMVVAGVADGRYVLVGLGLAVSIPMVIAGSALIMWLLDRLPIIVWAGAAMIGWIGGQLLVSDPAVRPHLDALISRIFAIDTVPGITVPYLKALDPLDLLAGLAGAVIVVVIGALLRRQAGAGSPP